LRIGERIKALRVERGLQQRQLALASSLAPSMVSQIESGRLTPSLHTVGRLASALRVPVAALFEIPACNRISISRKRECPVVQFDGSAETWRVLGTGLFRGKIRAVVSTIGRKGPGVRTDRVVIGPGQMKLFYVLEGKVALDHDGERHVLEAGDSAVLDGGLPHTWENLGTKPARALWVILG